MFISEIKLWNFRKYGNGKFDLKEPDLTVPLHKGLNVLVGENDSGKTAIIDSVKLVLKTHAYEWIKVEEDDFFGDSTKLRIELLFEGFEAAEAKNFTEWLGWKGNGKDAVPILRLILQAERTGNRILPSDVRAGMDDRGGQMSVEAKDYLKATYLQPMRDAEADLVPKRNSRLSQILRQHSLFEGKSDDHELVIAFDHLNETIQDYFQSKGGKSEIAEHIDRFLKKFIDEGKESKFNTGKAKLAHIFEKLALEVAETRNPGLGTLNRLYMAFELLHLQKSNWSGLRLALIEELEAHLHPQAQMKVIEALQLETKVQFILTTHSPNLASKVKLKNLILCHKGEVYPLGGENPILTPKGRKIDPYTQLDPSDYAFLEHFLDVTKANLFFAKGVILVEGWSEELLIPVIADKIGCNLTKHEVSIVNVGSTAYQRYKKIFLRRGKKQLEIPVAVVTDLDIRPNDKEHFDEVVEQEKRARLATRIQNVKVFVAPRWTLEWCLSQSKIADSFQEAVVEVHPKSEYATEFLKKLSHSLQKKKLKKTLIAANLSQKLIGSTDAFDDRDEWLQYLVDAIRYACRKEEDAKNDPENNS